MPLLDDSTARNLNDFEPAANGRETTATEVGPQPISSERADEAQRNDLASEDFATALETFTPESEADTGDDHVIRGTVLKVTPTHVVVDIGAKSEGMVPIAEVLGHDGQPQVSGRRRH